jgi:hypothetical protein
MANFLGNYDFPDQLERAHPNATTGDYANVLKSQTVFVFTGGVWVNSYSPVGTGGASFEINGLVQTQQQINISSDPNSVTAPTIEHFVDAGVAKHEIKIPEAKTFGVSAGLVSKTDWDLLQTLGDNYEYYEIFEIVTSDTGTVTKPSQSTILLDRYTDGVDAIITELDSQNFPIDAPARDALGNVITTTFDADGHYDLSATPVSPAVAIVYLIRIPAKYANNVTDSQIVNKIGVSEEHYSNPNPTPYAVGGIPKGETFLNRNMTNMWDRLLYPITPTVYESIQFDKSLSADPTHDEGILFYDKIAHSLAYYNEISGIKNNIGQENWVRVCNRTGSAIANGSVVYINGADAVEGVPTVELAIANEYNMSRIIGIATHNIADDTCGYITAFGLINDLDTSAYSAGQVVYLSDTVAGAFTDTAPTGGSFTVAVGIVSKVDASMGRLFCYPRVQEYTVEISEKLGWSTESQSKPTLTFTNATRTLALGLIGTEFHYYHYGVKHTKTSDSIQLPDEEGLYVIYYNADALQYIKNPTDGQIDIIIRNNPTVAYVYWNATGQKAEYIGNELHMFEMNQYTHAYLHAAFRARYIYGLLPVNIVSDGNGDIDASAQFGVQTGMILDEDLPTFINAVASTTGLPIYYLSGPEVSPVIRSISNPGFSVTNTGTGRLAYNTISAGNWVLSEVNNDDFVLCHVIAVNDNRDSNKLIAFVGQAQYTTLTTARIGAIEELKTLRTVGIIPQEVKAIATFIFQTNNGYDNAIKGRIRTTEEGDDFIDLRTTYLSSGGGAGGGGTVTNEYSDDLFRIYDGIDITKKLAFETSGITTATTRTITVPDRNLDLANPVFTTVTTDGKVGVRTSTPVRTLDVLQEIDAVESGIGVQNSAQSKRVNLWINGLIGILQCGGGTASDELSLRGKITCNQTYGITVGATNRDLYIDNTGLIGYVVSILESKKDITDIDDTSWIYQLKPKSFYYRKKDDRDKYTDETDGTRKDGLIAEEVIGVHPELTYQDEDGTLCGVNYSQLIVPLLNEIQKLRKELDELKAAE